MVDRERRAQVARSIRGGHWGSKSSCLRILGRKEAVIHDLGFLAEVGIIPIKMLALNPNATPKILKTLQP